MFNVMHNVAPVNEVNDSDSSEMENLEAALSSVLIGDPGVSCISGALTKASKLKNGLSGTR